MVSFGLGFHLLFIKQANEHKGAVPYHSVRWSFRNNSFYFWMFKDAFDSGGWALLKTYIMMIGEFDMESIFTESEDFPKLGYDPNLLPFPYVSTGLFIIFVFICSIVLMNLMVGLAVDDIGEIRERAEKEMLALQV